MHSNRIYTGGSVEITANYVGFYTLLLRWRLASAMLVLSFCFFFVSHFIAFKVKIFLNLEILAFCLVNLKL